MVHPRRYYMFSRGGYWAVNQIIAYNGSLHCWFSKTRVWDTSMLSKRFLDTLLVDSMETFIEMPNLKV